MSGPRFLPVLRIELRLILREWLTWAVFAVLLAALCLGASTGARRVADERAAIAQAAEDSARSRREAKETAARYASPSGVKINYWQDPTHAFGYMHNFFTAYAVKPPTPLALLSAGQREIQPSVMKTSFGFSTVFEELAGTLKDMPVPVVFDRMGHLPEPAGPDHPGFEVIAYRSRLARAYVPLAPRRVV